MKPISTDFEDRLKLAKKVYKEKKAKGYTGPAPRDWSKDSVAQLKKALGPQQKKCKQ